MSHYSRRSALLRAKGRTVKEGRGGERELLTKGKHLSTGGVFFWGAGAWPRTRWDKGELNLRKDLVQERP